MRGTLRLTVRHVVIHDGTSTAVVYATDAHGVELAVAVRAKLARHLRSALALGETPIIEAEPAAVLVGFPGYPPRPTLVARGQGLAEYGIVVALVAVLAIALLIAFSANLNGLLSPIGGTL